MGMLELDERLMADFAQMEVNFADGLTLVRRGEVVDLLYWRHNLIGIDEKMSPLYEMVPVIRVARTWSSMTCNANRQCPLIAGGYVAEQRPILSPFH